jgi:hypothetical protein
VLASLQLVTADDEFLTAAHKAEHQLRSFEVSTEPLNPDDQELGCIAEASGESHTLESDGNADF